MNLKDVPYLKIDPAQEPTEVVAKPTAGYRIGRPDRLGPGPEVVQDRNPFHEDPYGWHRICSWARGEHLQVSLICGDATRLPLQDAVFDGVITAQVLDNLR